MPSYVPENVSHVLLPMVKATPCLSESIKFTPNLEDA